VKAFLLSPNITAYRGNCAEQILVSAELVFNYAGWIFTYLLALQKAMKDLNVADLPPEQNVLQVNEVLSFISNQLTSFRAVIKQKAGNPITALGCSYDDVNVLTTESSPRSKLLWVRRTTRRRPRATSPTSRTRSSRTPPFRPPCSSGCAWLS
jgi:hypothetical protein